MVGPVPTVEEEVVAFYTRLPDAEYKMRLTKLINLIASEAERDDLRRLRVRSDRGRIAQKRRLGMDNSV